MRATTSGLVVLAEELHRARCRRVEMAVLPVAITAVAVRGQTRLLFQSLATVVVVVVAMPAALEALAATGHFLAVAVVVVVVAPHLGLAAMAAMAL